MDARTRNQQEFSRQAPSFAAAPGLQAGHVTERLRALAGDAGRGRVLDWACGPGLVSHELAGAARSLVGLDVTRSMLDLATTRCAGIGSARFFQGAVESLPFADGCFDAAVTRLSLHHLPEPERALAEVRRVLRPGGVAVIADLVGSEDPETRRLRDALETLRDPSHQSVLSVARIRSDAEAAGLRVVAEEQFDQDRGFREWAAIVAEDARTGPLETVMRTLAETGRRAGIDLRIENDELRFTYSWLLLAAEVPRG